MLPIPTLAPSRLLISRVTRHAAIAEAHRLEALAILRSIASAAAIFSGSTAWLSPPVACARIPGFYVYICYTSCYD